MVSGVRFGAHIRSSPSGGTPRARAILEFGAHATSLGERSAGAACLGLSGARRPDHAHPAAWVSGVGWSAFRRVLVEAARGRHFLGFRFEGERQKVGRPRVGSKPEGLWRRPGPGTSWVDLSPGHTGNEVAGPCALSWDWVVENVHELI